MGVQERRQQPVTPPHADFAAVNVNIWLTPDSANLDPETGGLDIYDVEAPPSWEFDKYNKDGRAIREFLRESAATVTKIPYRANRAIHPRAVNGGRPGSRSATGPRPRRPTPRPVPAPG